MQRTPFHVRLVFLNIYKTKIQYQLLCSIKIWLSNSFFRSFLRLQQDEMMSNFTKESSLPKQEKHRYFFRIMIIFFHNLKVQLRPINLLLTLLLSSNSFTRIYLLTITNFLNFFRISHLTCLILFKYLLNSYSFLESIDSPVSIFLIK